MRISDWSSDVCSSDLQRMRARKAEVALYAEAIGKPYRGDLRQAEASKLGTAETKVGEAEQGVAVIGKLGREPCRRTHWVEQLDHRHRVRRGLPVDRKSTRLNSSH